MLSARREVFTRNFEISLAFHDLEYVLSAGKELNKLSL